MVIDYRISDIVPYINWIYFFHAWGLSGKPESEQEKQKQEALRMLEEWENRYQTHAVVEIVDANSDGDDIIAADTRIPFLRQQKPTTEGMPNLCLADFIRPLSSGITDKLGIFAATVDAPAVSRNSSDCYQTMLAQTLADRLAEATAERLHQEVRTKIWGYAPDEQASIDDLLNCRYVGIRPAVGYPSIPDASINFMIDNIINMRQIGIRLTESGMMTPHASVSGLMFAHPQAKYFSIGDIGKDQMNDYARRRGLPMEMMKKFLKIKNQ